jgi:hypothetical protein
MISVRQASAYAYTGAHTCRNAIARGRSQRLWCLLRSATIAPHAHRPFSPKRRDQQKVVEDAIALKGLVPIPKAVPILERRPLPALPH